MKIIAELETRRYFDQYLKEVWPVQQQALQTFATEVVKAHNFDPKAHGGVEYRFTRLVWVALGVFLAGGAGGVGFARLFPILFG